VFGPGEQVIPRLGGTAADATTRRRPDGATSMRRGHAGVARHLWQSRLERGLLRITVVTRHLTPGIEARAVEVQILLAERGEHRSASVPDLLVAATAEKLGLTVLAVDTDFDLIAQVTGRRVETLDFA
jgi:predicted nucleic acid-binding protein